MADSLYTSERLCKVITQNFREDTELKQRLRSLEIKRRQALVRIILKTLEIERDIGPLLLPGVAKTAAHAYRRLNKKPVLSRSSSGSSQPAGDRRAVNEESYQQLIAVRSSQIRQALQSDSSNSFVRRRPVYSSLRLPEITKVEKLSETPMLESRISRMAEPRTTVRSDSSALRRGSTKRRLNTTVVEEKRL